VLVIVIVLVLVIVLVIVLVLVLVIVVVPVTVVATVTATAIAVLFASEPVSVAALKWHCSIVSFADTRTVAGIGEGSGGHPRRIVGTAVVGMEQTDASRP
jgi:O-glycosyl hydrolase